MTAVYTLAHSCLSQDSPLSVSPSSVHSSSSFNNGHIARRSSLSNNHHHHHHHHSHGTSSYQNGFSSSSSYTHHQASLPVNIEQKHQQQQQLHIQPVPSPILSVSPPKNRSSSSSSSYGSFSSSVPSSVTTGNSGLSNLFKHHAKPTIGANGTSPATVPPSAAAPPVAVTSAAAASAAVPAQGINTATIPSQAAIVSSLAKKNNNPVLPRIHSLSVIDTFAQVLSEVDIDSCEASGENAFLICDLGRVYSKYLQWQSELGSRIEPFFAVKCNPDPLIIKLMVSLGIGFDCASHQEISSVLQAGASNDKIIYANPCKASSFIRHAASKGVEMMTFDNEDELLKISKFHPHAKMVLRILTDDSGSLCKLGLKFGSPLNKVRSLLLKAKELEINVIGISFHVGSGCTNPLLFGDAVARAKWAFEVGASLGFNFTLLDVGGGFGGDNFVEIAGILREKVEEYFPASEGVRVIAEPGRYFVAEAFEMATNIIARRGKGTSSSVNSESPSASGVASSSSTRMENDDAHMDDVDEEEEAMVMYYINDGVYGAFNCTMFDHQVVHPKVLTSRGSFISSPTTQTNESTYEQCSIWGPTCDSIDCVSSKSYLPTGELDVGDWLRWENMGAYTICAASQFNGFKQSIVHYCVEADKGTEEEIRELLSR